jgi:hypothetical protein
VEAAAGLSRTWADCYGYLLVATGRAEAMSDSVAGDWDTAALLPIVEEAGGVFTSWEGARTGLGGSAVATNRALAGEVRPAARRLTRRPRQAPGRQPAAASPAPTPAQRTAVITHRETAKRGHLGERRDQVRPGTAPKLRRPRGRHPGLR